MLETGPLPDPWLGAGSCPGWAREVSVSLCVRAGAGCDQTCVHLQSGHPPHGAARDRGAQEDPEAGLGQGTAFPSSLKMGGLRVRLHEQRGLCTRGETSQIQGEAAALTKAGGFPQTQKKELL